jgi:mono/diheme cytochrome c family protein
MSLATAARHLAATIVFIAAAQPPLTIREGMYSAAQARRGRAVYEMHCSRCHGNDLNGVSGSALEGEGFMRHWEGRTVERLFRKIRDTMPPQGGDSIADGDTLDVVAYVLQQNGFPDGAMELASDPAVLADIQIVARTGLTPPPNGALVQVTGCLTHDGARDWQLINATEPKRTTLDARPRPDRQAADAPIGGDRTIRLLNVFPNPAPHEGHTMQATGLLIRQVGGDRVNVMTMEMIESRCGR